VEQLGLLPWGAALAGIHTPLNWEQYRAAQTRLAFQELLCIQLAALLERQQMLATVPSPSSSPTASTAASTTATTTDASSDENGPAAAGSSKRGASGHGRRKKLEAGDGAAVSSDEQREAASPSPSPSPAAAVTVAAGGVGPSRPSDMSMANQSLMEAVRGLLPYTLTASQQEVLGEVLADLGRPTPAMRLVQGEVGCGKTVVALLAMCCAVGSGWQAALMAPTELLAVQHYQTLWEALEGLPLASRPRLGLLTSSLKAREARAVRAAAAAGELDLVVGTHSLLNVPAWARLGLVVVDEQHK
jgi:RecG-like helicase